jgi:teichuronic acid biosynthesis glycosyltransferase TuaG
MGSSELNTSPVPDITIVVPAYNSAAWITDTLEGLLAQSHAAWEAIVADDASRDATAAIVSDYAKRDARIRLMRMPVNSGGPAGPRNAAVSEARGEWIAFCDADDVWHPRKLEWQLAVAKRTGATMVCSSIRDFHDAATLSSAFADTTPTGSFSTIGLWRLLGKNIIPNSSVLCRRQALLDAGCFDRDPDLVAVEDYDLWVRMNEQGALMLKLDAPLVAYRRVVGSLSARKLTLARRVTKVLKRHFRRTGNPLGFYLTLPFLMASYVGQSLYLRVWQGRL